jgi:hypothetical protein
VDSGYRNYPPVTRSKNLEPEIIATCVRWYLRFSLSLIRPDWFDPLSLHPWSGLQHFLKALIEAIFDYIDNNNQNPHVFVWTAPADKIMNKIAKCKEALDALH